MKKKAFTLIELLVVLIVTMILLVLLITLLSSTFRIYNNVVSAEHVDSYTIKLVSNIENLTDGCDYVSTNAEKTVLYIHTGSNSVVVNSNDYGLIATFDIDTNNRKVIVNVGGEEYCVQYIQKAPA